VLYNVPWKEGKFGKIKKPVIIISIIAVISVSAVLETLYLIERKEFIEKIGTEYIDCVIQLESGGTENQAIQCELEYIKFVKEGCKKYQGVQGCDNVESIIDKNDLRDISP